jgi:hypothetical protein
MKDETKIERIIEAIERVSFLPKNSKQVIILLLKHKSSLPAPEIARLCGFSSQHACSVVRRMFEQKLIVKVKTIHAVTHYIVNKEWGNGVLGTYDRSEIYNK